MPNHRNVYISLATSMSKTGKFQLTPLVEGELGSAGKLIPAGVAFLIGKSYRKGIFFSYNVFGSGNAKI